MKKILFFFTANYPFGNGETFIENEMPYLAEAFDQIMLISNDTTSPQTRDVPANVRLERLSYELDATEKKKALGGFFSPNFWQELRIMVATYRLLPNRLRLNTLLVSWYKAQKAADYIQQLATEFQGDAICAYSYWANDMALGCALARKNGWVQKAVCRAHGWDVYFERTETGFLPFRTFLAQHVDRYSFIAENGFTYTQQKIGAGFSSLCRNYLGVPKVTDAPIARKEPFRIVSCSSLIPLKRVHLLAEALLQADFEVAWTHIGDGTERTKIEEILAQLPANVQVNLMGNVPNREVIAFYQSWQPSVFINVSETEGLPVSIMEAMSCGIPVIATDVGGVQELVENGKSGVLLSSVVEASEVVEALKAFSEIDSSTYKAMANAAFSKWEEGFSAERNFSVFTEFLIK